jgi:predicted TIM-barrel fold metal-dependent hydrolase
MPRGACDSHFHAFGPYVSYPLDARRTYTPPPAPLQNYRRVASALGIERSVIVQPSVYGSDNTCMLDALRTLGTSSARGIAMLDKTAGPAELREMHRLGVRGVRYNSVTGEPTAANQLLQTAERIAPLGWHLQLFIDPQTLHDSLPVIRALPVDVVIDHFGQIDPSEGLTGRAFRTLIEFLESGRGWVKLTGYRCSKQRAPYADLTPFVRELLALRPDRLLWGSNWPHPIRYHDMPEDGSLLDALALWAGDDTALAKILVHNPQALYGFDRQYA